MTPIEMSGDAVTGLTTAATIWIVGPSESPAAAATGLLTAGAAVVLVEVIHLFGRRVDTALRLRGAERRGDVPHNSV